MSLRDALNGFWNGLRKGPMIPVNPGGNMVPVTGPGGQNMIPVSGGNQIPVGGNMIPVNSDPSMIAVAARGGFSSGMVPVNRNGSVPVADTTLNPTNADVPSAWINTFMGPGQPFAMQTTRDRDAQEEPRSFQYVPNVNSTIAPRLVYGLMPFSELRMYGETVPEVSGAFRMIIDEMKVFVPSLVSTKDDSDVDIPELKWMIESPDRVNPFAMWLDRLGYNTLVYDAPAIFKMRDLTPKSTTLAKGQGLRMRKTELIPETGQLQWYCPECGAANTYDLSKKSKTEYSEDEPYCAECLTYAPDNAMQKMGLAEFEEDLEKDLSDNEVIGLRVIDGSTIFCLVDELGEAPKPPAPAFTQVIFGTPRMFLNTRQLWYRPRHLRADAPYGRSFIEDSIQAVKLLFRLWDYEYEKYGIGNIPESMATLPPSFTTTEEILQYEEVFNARMSGSNKERPRMRFVPTGTTILTTKELGFNKESYDAATNAVRMAVGIPKSEAGEAPEGMMGGKGFAEAMQSTFYRMCIGPFKAFIEGLFNEILKENGYLDVKFTLKFPQDTMDPDAEEQKWNGRFQGGIARRDEARQGLGMSELGGDDGKFLVSPGPAPAEGEEGGGMPGMPPGGPGSPQAGGGMLPGKQGGLPPQGGSQGRSIRVKPVGKPIRVRPHGRIKVTKLEKVTATNPIEIAELLGADWENVSKDEFVTGYNEEQEHITTVGGDESTVAQIALDHLAEDPQYYSKLKAAGLAEANEAADTEAASEADKVMATGDLMKPVDITIEPESLSSDDPGVEYKREDLQKGEYDNSVMVALMMPDEIAEKLANSGIQWPEGAEPLPASEMHVTMAYLGEKDQLDQDKIIGCIKNFVIGRDPITGRINGIGRFLESHKDGFGAVYANFDAPLLPAYRQDLIDYLKDCGVEIEENHGFTPHITLAYMPTDKPMPDVTGFEVIETTIGDVTLGWGEVYTFFQFASTEKDPTSEATPTEELQKLDSIFPGLSLQKHCGVCSEDD
jgi:2'-5' RNA ligase